MTKLFNKYQKLLEQDTLTERQIISLKSRISWNPCSLTPSEVEELKEELEYDRGNCRYDITEAHAQKGIDYLRSKCFKMNGQKRNTKQLVNMPQEFFDVIREYSHFTFEGFEEVHFNTFTGKSEYMPVWRIHTKGGKHFDYYMDLGLVFNHTGEYTKKLELVG